MIAARWRERATVLAGAPPALVMVRWRALPFGDRDEKFEALAALTLGDAGWLDCPADARAPFLPASTGAWATYPKPEDLFAYNGSGVMPGRTCVIAPDAGSLQRLWARLVATGRLWVSFIRPAVRHSRCAADQSAQSVAMGVALFDTAALLAAGAFASAAAVQRRARQADTSVATARLEGFD